MCITETETVTLIKVTEQGKIIYCENHRALKGQIVKYHQTLTHFCLGIVVCKVLT